MEAIFSSEKSVDFQRTTRHYITEDRTAYPLATCRRNANLLMGTDSNKLNIQLIIKRGIVFFTGAYLYFKLFINSTE
jgi:hypothetical protein